MALRVRPATIDATGSCWSTCTVFEYDTPACRTRSLADDGVEYVLRSRQRESGADKKSSLDHQASKLPATSPVREATVPAQEPAARGGRPESTRPSPPQPPWYVAGTAVVRKPRERIANGRLSTQSSREQSPFFHHSRRPSTGRSASPWPGKYHRRDKMPGPATPPPSTAGVGTAHQTDNLREPQTWCSASHASACRANCGTTQNRSSSPGQV